MSPRDKLVNTDHLDSCGMCFATVSPLGLIHGDLCVTKHKRLCCKISRKTLNHKQVT